MFCNMLDLFPSQIQWQFSCSALIQTQPNTAPASKIYIETCDTNNRHRSLELWHDAYIIAFIIQKLCLEMPELSYRSHRSPTPKFVGNGTTYLCFGKWVSTKRTKHYNKLTLAPFLPVAKKKKFITGISSQESFLFVFFQPGYMRLRSQKYCRKSNQWGCYPFPFSTKPQVSRGQKENLVPFHNRV